MRGAGRRNDLISVIVPAYAVEAYLPACLDSLLAQTYPHVEIVVVDDGSPDASGAIADDYAGRHEAVRAIHIDNRGLGGARNEGLRHTTGSVIAYADSDDVVPPKAYAAMHRQLRRGAELVTGSIARWWPEEGRLVEPRWMQRSHARRQLSYIDFLPELLGDVFAWNKLYRRDFWEGNDLTWLEGVRYEDQPTLTDAYLKARRIGVVPDVVYHWRMRSDGTSITQQRASLADLEDRWTTKRISRQRVLAYGSDTVTRVFQERVLPGDLHVYFDLIPGCTDEWYSLLESGMREFFGARSVTHSVLAPTYRLTGWLVEQGRRNDAALVMSYVASLPPGQRPARVQDAHGTRIEIPGLDADSVDRTAIGLRADER